MGQAPVHIHAGAPRTGSSAFQTYLDTNADAIRDQGFDLGYPDRDGAKGGRLKLWMPAPRHDVDTVKWRNMKLGHNLGKHVRDPSHPLILSEENMAGRMNPFFSGRFFPTVQTTTRFLAEALQGRPVGTLLMLVRPYDQVFVSAFRKRAEEHAMGGFDRISDLMAGFSGGWVEVVKAFRDNLKPKRFVVQPYTRQRNEADLLTLLCPEIDSTGFQQPKARVNASLSDAALFALQERYENGALADRNVVEKIRARLKDTPAENPFAAFSGTQKDKLTQRYEGDLSVLRRLRGVEVVDSVQT